MKMIRQSSLDSDIKVLLNMAATVAQKDVSTFLRSKQNVSDKELAEEWAELDTLYNKR